MRRSAWCSFALVSMMLGCTAPPRPPTFVEVEGEEGLVREWAPEDQWGPGSIQDLPFYRVSRHMDACTPDLELSSSVYSARLVGVDEPPGATDSMLQLQCVDGRLFRSVVWQSGRTASEEECGGIPVSLGEYRPSFIIATADDIGTVAVQTDDDPTCAQLSVCTPVQQAGIIERSEQVVISLCQAPGRDAARPGAPAEEWSDCLAALEEGIDGDRCAFDAGCIGMRTVVGDWGAGPQPTEVEIIVWCGGGLTRFASTGGVVYGYR